eukprot:1413750-Prymnesium_polylepis.1
MHNHQARCGDTFTRLPWRAGRRVTQMRPSTPCGTPCALMRTSQSRGGSRVPSSLTWTQRRKMRNSSPRT